MSKSELPPVYDLYRHPPSSDFAIVCEGMGADQSFTQECDINWLLARVGLGHELVPRADYLKASYEDLSDVPGDYLEAVNLVDQAQDHFDSLPASIRNRFENDPFQLLSFLADGNNRQEAIELGLIDRPVASPVGAAAGGAAPPPKPDVTTPPS